MQLKKVSLQTQFFFNLKYCFTFSLTSDWLSGVSAVSIGGKKSWGRRWEHRVGIWERLEHELFDTSEAAVRRKI